LLFSVYLFYVVAMFVGDRRWPQPGWPVRGPCAERTEEIVQPALHACREG